MKAIGQRTSAAQARTAFQTGRCVAWSYNTFEQAANADWSIHRFDRACSCNSIGTLTDTANLLPPDIRTQDRII